MNNAHRFPLASCRTVASNLFCFHTDSNSNFQKIVAMKNGCAWRRICVLLIIITIIIQKASINIYLLHCFTKLSMFLYDKIYWMHSEKKLYHNFYLFMLNIDIQWNMVNAITHTPHGMKAGICVFNGNWNYKCKYSSYFLVIFRKYNY